MKSFGWLLVLAFVDLAVAGVMIGRGERGVALVFIVMAVLTAAFALFSKPALRRDPRGRLQPVDPPFSRVLGVAGAVAILGAAAYVAVSTGRPTEKPVRSAARPAALLTPAPAPAPRPVPRSESGNWMHKCVDASGHTSFQSAPCAPGSQQVWRRPVTPEREPARVARTRASASPAARSGSAGVSGGWTGQRVRQQDSAACQAAREADRRYRRQPLSQVTHDGLRRHGDAIREACG